MRRWLFAGLFFLCAGLAHADNTFDYNPKTGRLDLVLDNSNAGVITGTTATFTGYDCTSNANGGALTADASGNLRCSDDDTGAGGGDPILINNSAVGDAAGATFNDTPTISWTLNTTTSPDTVSGIVVAASIGTTQIGTDGVSADELNATGVEAELEAALDIDGDVVSTGMASTVIQANAVALTTDTTGNYVESLTCSETMSGCVASAEDSDQLVGVKGSTLTASHLNSANAPTAGQSLTFDGPTTGKFRWASASGSGDITDVYNCASGDCNSIAATDGDLLDFSAVNGSSATEGIILPQASNCNTASAEGQLCWNSTLDVLSSGSTATGIIVSGFMLTSGMAANSDADDFYTGMNAANSDNTEGNVDDLQLPMALTCKGFTATHNSTPAAGTNFTVTLHSDGSATGMPSCGFGNGVNLNCVDSTTLFTLPRFARVTAFHDETGSAATPSRVSWTAWCWPAQSSF